MNIPYGRQFIDESDIHAVVETLKSDFMTQGPKVAEFEQVVAEYHGCKYAVAFSNGTAALHACYYASEIKIGESFITSPITFAATANAGLYVGAVPKFVDISLETYNLDIKLLDGVLTEDVKVVTPVSFAGYPVDLKSIREIIGEDRVLIHDAAHAIGAKFDGRNIVDYADMTVLSFHPVKHIACGEGGMVLTNSKEYYDKLILFRTHGITKNTEQLSKIDGPWYYEMLELGYNYRLTDMQSALGITQMEKLDHSLYKRNMIAREYIRLLNELNWIILPDVVSDLNWLDEEIYFDLDKKPEVLHSYHLFPIRLDESVNRKDFYEYLRSKSIFSQVHYIPVHTLPYYQDNFGFSYGDFPNAESFYNSEISLPMFPTLTEEEFNYIITVIKEYPISNE